MSGATLPEAFAAAAAAVPGSPVNFPGSREYLTLRDVDLAAGSAARGLVAAGVVPGDRVGILSRNNADFLIALFGINAAGGRLPASAAHLGW